MSYSADTFVADEIPTTAKWNKLWNNDASFNDGTGIASGAITFAKLLATIFSGQVSTYTNTGTGGGTGYYINLGGIKLCWGINGSSNMGTSAAVGTSVPASFFTTIQYSSLVMGSSSTGDAQVRQTTAPSITTGLVGWVTSISAVTGTLAWFIIGT